MAKIKRLEMEKANKAAAIAGMNMYKKAAPAAPCFYAFCWDDFGAKNGQNTGGRVGQRVTSADRLERCDQKWTAGQARTKKNKKQS